MRDRYFVTLKGETFILWLLNAWPLFCDFKTQDFYFVTFKCVTAILWL